MTVSQSTRLHRTVASSRISLQLGSRLSSKAYRLRRWPLLKRYSSSGGCRGTHGCRIATAICHSGVGPEETRRVFFNCKISSENDPLKWTLNPFRTGTRMHSHSCQPKSGSINFVPCDIHCFPLINLQMCDFLNCRPGTKLVHYTFSIVYGKEPSLQLRMSQYKSTACGKSNVHIYHSAPKKSDQRLVRRVSKELY